ncbi:hypothetical protein AB5J72_36600 [Streptomyces sp. CG1]|uniref:hypothetical protein n=1 Tax=Streptomyces sp. CG1 TaxID=1287523 RepID=UPI0034E250F9
MSVHAYNASACTADPPPGGALTAGADPLHLALVFNLSHSTASRYATIAQNLLDDQIEQAAESE